MCTKMMSHTFFAIYALLISVIMTDGFPSTETVFNSEPTVCQSEICRQAAENLLRSMNQNVNPCDNFYEYSCGNFLKRNPVPVNKIEYGTFTMVTEDVRHKIQEILTSNETDKMSSALKSAVSLYKSCLETTESSGLVLEILIDKLGGCPMINGAQWNPSSYDVIGAVYNNMIYGNAPFFSVDVGVDEKNSSVNIINVDQVDMNLDIDYYLDPNGYEHVLEAYVQLITNFTQVLVGDSNVNVEEMALGIVDLETAIANISSSFIDRQNTTRMYNRMTVGQLQNLTDPDKNLIDWVDFLQGLLGDDTITDDEPIIVNEPMYMSSLFKILDETNLDVLANYIAWNYLMFVADDAWGALEQLHFEFQEVIGGAKNRTEKWEKCADSVEEAYSYSIGQMYVNNYTDKNTPIDALNMLKLLQQSFIGRLHQNDFMDNNTKAVAIDKVNSMFLLIGYPKWLDDDAEQKEYYENYPNMTGTYLLDMLAVSMAVAKTSYSTLREPTDPSTFGVSPMDVNAVYTPTYNSITVPIGILNPPFYQSGAPSATNFGGLGTILGHEITHGFDNDGRKFDQHGNLKPWWPDNVVDAFDQESQCFVKQYSRCCPLYDKEANEFKCVNGYQTLGENMADNGGLEAAYQAWKEWTKVNGEDQLLPGMDNITLDQIFFLSFANIWCESTTVGSLLAELSSDEHSPESCRVNGAVANSEDFAEAFNCSKSSTKRKGKRCTIW